MITIFTPTFNRANLLSDLYESLCRQTCFDFEWIIVDDGSVDNTREVVEKFYITDKFSIRYFHKENEGKHIAYNFAVEKAKGEWFFIVDSDDLLPENSIEIILKYCGEINDKDSFVGVGGNIVHRDGTQIGNKSEYSTLDLTPAQFRRKYFGDKAEIIRTEVARKYRFPQFEGEKFMQESFLWLSISNDGYLIRWFNESIYIRDYLEGGLTNTGKSSAQKSPLSRSFADNHIVSSKDIRFIDRVKSSINYYRYGKLGGLSYKYLFTKSNSKLLSLISIVIACLCPIDTKK